MPNHYIGVGLLTIGISGLSRVRTELLRLAIVATLAPHPVQMHCQFPRHRHFRDLASTPHGQMEKLAAPLPLTAHRDLRRFHQQKTQQHVTLLADVSQSLPISARLLLGIISLIEFLTDLYHRSCFGEKLLGDYGRNLRANVSKKKSG
jgi:hypothetical protein